MSNARGTNRIMSISFKISHQHSTFTKCSARDSWKNRNSTGATEQKLVYATPPSPKTSTSSKQKNIKKELSGKMTFPRLPHCACMRHTLVPSFSMWLRKSTASQQCKRAIATPRQRHGVSRRAGGPFPFFWARIVSLARRWCAVQRGSRQFALRLRSSHCRWHHHATPRRCKTAFFDLLSQTSNSWAFSLLLIIDFWCRQQLLGVFSLFRKKKSPVAGTRGRNIAGPLRRFYPEFDEPARSHRKVKNLHGSERAAPRENATGMSRICTTGRARPLLMAQVVTLCLCAQNSGKPPPWKRVQIAILTHQVKPDHRACVVAGTTHKTNSMWENLPEPDGPSRWVLPTAGLCGRALDVPRRRSPNRRRGPHAGRGKVRWRNHSRNWPPSPLFSCSSFQKHHHALCCSLG